LVHPNSPRLELAPQGTHVLDAHLGDTDTPTAAGLEVGHADPADIVGASRDSLTADVRRALADQLSKDVRTALGAPLPALYPTLASSRRRAFSGDAAARQLSSEGRTTQTPR
jgi:hypothetical protein